MQWIRYVHLKGIWWRFAERVQSLVEVNGVALTGSYKKRKNVFWENMNGERQQVKNHKKKAEKVLDYIPWANGIIISPTFFSPVRLLRTVHTREELVQELYFVAIFIDDPVWGSVGDKPLGIHTAENKRISSEGGRRIKYEIGEARWRWEWQFVAVKIWNWESADEEKIRYGIIVVNSFHSESW
jgi:hypothetical protein